VSCFSKLLFFFSHVSNSVAPSSSHKAEKEPKRKRIAKRRARAAASQEKAKGEKEKQEKEKEVVLTRKRIKLPRRNTNRTLFMEDALIVCCMADKVITQEVRRLSLCHVNLPRQCRMGKTGQGNSFDIRHHNLPLSLFFFFFFYCL
jgi:hypothetical protein